MLLISGVNIAKFYTLICLIIGIFFSACNTYTSSDKTNNLIELELMQKGALFVEEGKYDQAYNLYSQFLTDYPNHPYIDDAAYRLAYISVIADEKNPHFDYEQGLSHFQNFIENYPNSRYIIACQNWKNLIEIMIRLSEGQSAKKNGKGMNAAEINRLKIELKRVKAENADLKQTLEDLQKAIER